MARTEVNSIPPHVQKELKSLFGQPCCRQFVGYDKSFFIGFGKVIMKRTRRGEAPHGLWEIGVYVSAWRVIRDGVILCGSSDTVDNIDELGQRLPNCDGAKCVSLEMLSDFDVRIWLDNGICIDVLASAGDSDEIVHVFLPSRRVAFLSRRSGWDVEDSDKPTSK